MLRGGTSLNPTLSNLQLPVENYGLSRAPPFFEGRLAATGEPRGAPYYTTEAWRTAYKALAGVVFACGDFSVFRVVGQRSSGLPLCRAEHLVDHVDHVDQEAASRKSSRDMPQMGISYPHGILRVLPATPTGFNCILRVSGHRSCEGSR